MKQVPQFDVAILTPSIGWPADCLADPDGPALALRLAAAFAQVRRVYDAATPAERQEFWHWLCD